MTPDRVFCWQSAVCPGHEDGFVCCGIRGAEHEKPKVGPCPACRDEMKARLEACR